MNTAEFKKIIDTVTEELKSNYSKYNTAHYGLADRDLIPFATLETRSRVVRSEGTDEDDDKLICYDKDGWFIYDITVQVGAGVQKVISEHHNSINKDEVINYFNKLSIIEKMNFISTAYSIIRSSSMKTDLF